MLFQLFVLIQLLLLMDQLIGHSQIMEESNGKLWCLIKIMSLPFKDSNKQSHGPKFMEFKTNL